MSFPLKFAAGACALGLSACAVHGADRVLFSLDPSNPDAPASAVRPMTALAPPMPADAPPSTPKPVSSPKGFVCPMHPDVTSDAPARCPRCGMKLVAHAHGAQSTSGHGGHAP
ncbi:heavy metal-binding domain-containing protein [Archangium primigenium]|uniref:heavy metal-binding domain-containing protein n=1 Tax=[Archangium] primigenium TaxID=2792470 RepID=UPI001957D1DD|nr:heavy metal-binding domain-containing protein [Archangium primigenium]MBM7115838.1 hypothetical protein [Archangium primigenium]